MKASILLFAISIAARADISQTATFSDGVYLSLDDGHVTSSPGPTEVHDIRWTNGSIVPVGTAKIFNVGIRTAAQFDLITESDIKTRLILGGVASIPANNLVAGDVIDCVTNFGNASKIFITRAGGGTLAVNFFTYQSAPPGAPTITAVLNNSSRLGDGLPNSGIAPSSLFIVQGTRLGDSVTAALHTTLDPGLPLELNGLSLTATVNGTVTHPALYYTCNLPQQTPCDPALPDVRSQVAAVLPANTPIGTGTLTVTYNGLTSVPFAIHVVRSAPGLNIYGANTAVATDLSGGILTFTHSGSPGEVITLWATGLGSDPADSDTVYSATPHSVNVNLQVYIGGIPANVSYQGSGGYPGVNIINVKIPDSVTTGCWVSVAAVAESIVSNVATLPIHNGGGECVDSLSGLKGSQLTPGGTFRAGFVSLILSSTSDKNNNQTIEYTTTANFSKYTGVGYDPVNSVSPGGCILLPQQPSPIPGMTGLDAGTITLKGPAGLDVTLQKTLGITGAYNATLPGIPQSGGTYTWTGNGGAAVGSLSATLNLSNPLLTWTNTNATVLVNKNNGLSVTWTGGNPGSWVLISGVSVLSSTRPPIRANYQCVERVEAGQFTVPPYILSALPTGQSASTASTQVTNIIYFPLSASGLDFASGVGYVGYTVNTTFAPGN